MDARNPLPLIKWRTCHAIKTQSYPLGKPARTWVFQTIRSLKYSYLLIITPTSRYVVSCCITKILIAGWNLRRKCIRWSDDPSIRKLKFSNECFFACIMELIKTKLSLLVLRKSKRTGNARKTVTLTLGACTDYEGIVAFDISRDNEWRKILNHTARKGGSSLHLWKALVLPAWWGAESLCSSPNDSRPVITGTVDWLSKNNGVASQNPGSYVLPIKNLPIEVFKSVRVSTLFFHQVSFLKTATCFQVVW